MGGDEVDPSSLPVGICGGVSMRVYVDRAKTMEARRSLRTIADLAKQAYERDGKLCASASSPRAGGDAALGPRERGGPLLHRAERDEDGGAFERDLGLSHLLLELELLQACVPRGAVGVEELRDGERACLVRDLGA